MTMLQPLDPLHANTVELLERELPIGRKGHLLISFRELNLVAVLDSRRQRIGWSWGPGKLDRPHQPSVLPSGNMLILDNAPKARRLRVIELDSPRRRGRLVLPGPTPQRCFSTLRGGAQHLPNNNILITHSERGRVIEVTRKRSIVWEFFNPDLQNPLMKGTRGPIYRMVRFRSGPQGLGEAK